MKKYECPKGFASLRKIKLTPAEKATIFTNISQAILRQETLGRELTSDIQETQGVHAR